MNYGKNTGMYYAMDGKPYNVRFILIMFLLILIIFFFSHIFLDSLKNNISDLSDDWELYKLTKGEYVPISDRRELNNIKTNEILCLFFVMKDETNRDTLLMKSNHQYIRVFLDNDKLFDNTTENTDDDPGVGLYFVRIPEEYDQKTLRIEVHSPYRFYMEMDSPIYLGTSKALFIYILTKAFPILFYFMISLLTGILLIVFSVYSYLHGVVRTDKLCLGVFSVLWGLYCISWDDIACLFLTPAAVSWLSAILHITYMLPFFCYFRLHFTICRRFTFLLQCCFYCLAGGMCFLLWLSAIEIPYAVLAFNYMLDAFFLPMIVIAWFEFRRGNPLIRFLSPAVLLILSGAVGTILEQYDIINGISFYLASIFIFICFNWFYQIKKIVFQRIQEKEDLKILKLKNSLILNRYEEMDSHIKKMREIRHEINHHLTAIQILCLNKNVDRISDYIQAVSSNEILKQDITYSSHPIVDGVLSNYAAQAKKSDIQFEHQIGLPASLSIPDTELLILLLNMLDNAMEASVRASEKWIRFEMLLKGSFLMICCQNSYCGVITRQNGKIVTRKEDKGIHGQGIPIMRSIADKYHSTLVIDYDSEKFMVKTVLQVE